MDDLIGLVKRARSRAAYHRDFREINTAEMIECMADAIEALQAQMAEARKQRDRAIALAEKAQDRLIEAMDRAGAARDKALEDAAMKATGFLVGNPEHGQPLRNPMSHEIADAIRAMKGEGMSDRTIIERIPSFGFARGAVVRAIGGGPNMLVVRGLEDRTVVVVCESDDGGSLRLRDPKTTTLELVAQAATPAGCAMKGERG